MPNKKYLVTKLVLKRRSLAVGPANQDYHSAISQDNDHSKDSQRTLLEKEACTTRQDVK